MPDLFALRDLEPPMGDTAGRGLLATTTALWTDAPEGEPGRRIVHARTVHLAGPVPLRRVGVRRAPGYHKCGSLVDLDHVEAFRVRAYHDGRWTTLLDDAHAETPRRDGVAWADLGGALASAVRVEVRRSHADGTWPSWNLASGAFLLDAATLPPLAPRDERLLDVGTVDLSGLPEGVTATHEDGAVRFRTSGTGENAGGGFDVAFALTRAAMTHLNVQGAGATADASSNLLRRAPGFSFQGPTLAPTGEVPVAMPSLRWNVEGTTTVRGNTVRYDLALGGRLRYVLTWTVEPDALRLHIVRTADHALRAAASSAWTMGFDTHATPPHVVGRLRTQGETGGVDLPAWLDLPGFGSLRVEAEGPTAGPRRGSAPTCSARSTVRRSRSSSPRRPPTTATTRSPPDAPRRRSRSASPASTCRCAKMRPAPSATPCEGTPSPPSPTAPTPPRSPTTARRCTARSASTSGRP